MERHSFMPNGWSSVDFLQNFELPSDMDDIFGELDYQLEVQKRDDPPSKSVETKRYADNCSDVGLEVQVCGIPDTMYDPLSVIRPLTEMEVLEACVDQAKKLTGLEGGMNVVINDTFDPTMLNVVFIPSKDNLYKDEGICVTSMGSFSMTYLRARLPEWGVLYSMSMGRESLQELAECYFVVNKTMEPKTHGKKYVVNAIAREVPVQQTKDGNDDLGLCVSDLSDNWIDIPKMVLTVGVVAEPNVVNFRVGAQRVRYQGKLSVGERYLFGIEDTRVYLLAVVYPNRSISLSEAMYVVSGNSLGICRGKGLKVDFREGKFVLYDDYCSVNPLHINLPPYLPGCFRNTIGFITGKVRLLSDGELRSMVKGGEMKLVDHYIPYREGVIARSRLLLLPNVYIARGYYGQYPRENIRLNHLFASGIHSTDVTSKVYDLKTVERLMTGVGELRVNENVPLKINLKRSVEGNDLEAIIDSMLQVYGSAVLKDIQEISKRSASEILEVMAEGVSSKKFYFNMRHGYLMNRGKIANWIELTDKIIEDDVNYFREKVGVIDISMVVHFGVSLLTLIVVYDRRSIGELFAPFAKCNLNEYWDGTLLRDHVKRSKFWRRLFRKK